MIISNVYCADKSGWSSRPLTIDKVTILLESNTSKANYINAGCLPRKFIIDHDS